MIRYILHSTIILIIAHNFSIAQKIAITFDDAPMRDGQYFTGKERTEMIIKKLREQEVYQAAFFCITNQFDSAGTERIKHYQKAGHLIANHSHTHSRISRIGSDSYIHDIATADSVLRELGDYKKWFRYPYLDEGQTIEVRDEIRRALTEMNYINAYVTVDNYDWYINSMLQKSLNQNKTVNYDKLEKFYVEHIWQSILFYDSLANQILGRSPSHILLLHENDLAALFIDKLIQQIISEGWKIISPVEAYNDEIASIVPNVLFNGQGRIAAIAYEMGMKAADLTQNSEDTDFLENEAEKLGIFE